MKHDYSFTKPRFGKQTIMLLVFFLAYLGMFGQVVTYQDGVALGVIKVEFEESMTPTLSRMQISTHGNQLTTGIEPFDKAVNSLQATKMERLFPEVPNASLEAKHRRHGLHLWYTIRFDEEVSLQKALATLKTVKGIKHVGLEYQKVLAPMQVTEYIPSPSTYAAQPFNDPMLKDQWHYINTGQLGLDGPKADINLAEAWKITAGSSDVIIAVHDQGIDVNHEDLKDNMWVNPGEIAGNGEDDDGNGYVDDIHGFNFVNLTGKLDAMTHGTHVGGTVAAVNNNGIGVAGVAGGTGKGDGVKLMSLQILEGADGANIARSFVYAADMGAVISQNSWGYSRPGAYEEDVLVGIDYFINTAGDYQDSPMKGGLVIFASGNDAADGDYYPGYYDRTFSVSAVGPEYKIAIYSNYGDWVEVSAPGGDQTTYDMARAGVLSTMPNNQYGYIHGTSMAAPHVSGIAGLVLANRTKQMTNTELWNILLTSTIDVDKYNPNYVGKLGTGTMDAALALKANTGVAPEAITTLKVAGMAQEFASLEWIVPDDKLDGAAHQFIVYYSEENLSPENIDKAESKTIANKAEIGETINVEITALKANTKYYFAVVAVDRWGNKSDLSNIEAGTTNDGPSIDVNTGNVEKLLSINASVPGGIATESFKLLNKAEGVLRWTSSIRNTGYKVSPIAYTNSFSRTNYTPQGIGTLEAEVYDLVRNEEASGQGMDFEVKEWKYVPYSRLYIGDTDPKLPTSGALKFNVTDPEGFNLTHVGFDLKYTLGTGPIIVEVYEGNLNKGRLLRSEILELTSAYPSSHSVPLKEHIHFKQNTSFYLVVHVPGGNGYSLAIGDMTSPEYRGLSLYSPDLGDTWHTFTDVGVPATSAWNIIAHSKAENIENLVSLSPSSATLNGNSELNIEATTNVNKLINGTYSANVVFESNDSKTPEYRMPLEINVSGQKPNIVHPRVVDYGSVFKQDSKTLDILIENYGYGLIENLTATVDNPQFEIIGSPNKIAARTTAVVRVKFTPTSEGNISGVLKLTNATNTYSISLFGTGSETSEITIDPVVRSFSDLSIGDLVTSEFNISNTGKYPLIYFIPGYDTQNIAAEFGKYHKAGYVVRSSNPTVSNNYIAYEYKDISSNGVDVTGVFVDKNYASVDLPFEFPFYGKQEKQIHITNKGFTVFNNFGAPSNIPELGKGLGSYISPLGFSISQRKNTKVYYRAESDHFIVQYNNIDSSIDAGDVTAQMVLYMNGDIRFYYKEIPISGRNRDNITVLIEDRDRTDGILLRDRFSDFYFENNTAIGFDYEGPDIITSLENGSGVIAPNQTVKLKVNMSTDSLKEGITKRNINIISNDPLHPISSHTAILEIVSGGTLDYEFSTDTLDFGLLYVNNSYTREFSIKNTGSKKLEIESVDFNQNVFNLSLVNAIDPGVNQLFTVSPNTSQVGDINELIKFVFADGSSKNVRILGEIKTAPDIAVDLSLVSANLELNDSTSTSFEIENTGGSELEVSVIGGQWFKFIESSNTSIKNYDYHVKEENNGEPSYNWIDITKTGKRLQTDDDLTGDKKLYWSDVELPFTFTYYGKEYKSVKVGDEGLLAFGGDPNAFNKESHPNLPIKNIESAYLFAMFTQGGFDYWIHPEDAGLYAQVYDDKVVITWMYYINLFGWGQSTQVILFKDGTIKIMYKKDPLTVNGTNSMTVGMQDIGGEVYKVISKDTRLNIEKTFTYMIMPDNTQVVEAGAKLEGNIKLESTDIYGGSFEDNFLIKTNVPDKAELKKPVAVKVNGEAAVELIKEVDLGEIEVFYDDTFGIYNTIEKKISLTNTGTAPLNLSYARMQEGNQYLTMLIEVSGRWGTEYLPISNFTPESFPQELILPGATYSILLNFAPEDEGSYEDTLVLETSVGEYKVNMKGFGFYPAAINVDETPIKVRLNELTENSKHTINFDNAEGGYKLDYNISIDYHRPGVEARPLEKTAKNNFAKANDSAINAVESLISAIETKPLAEPNRILKYFDESKINNSIGNQGFSSTQVATRFVADADGFNLAEVVNFFQVDGKVEGTYTVEIRVGGEDITKAVSMATAEVAFSNLEDISELRKSVVALESAIQILPNESFYVLITYPYSLTFPQALQIGGVEQAKGRYWWFDAEIGWLDFQPYISGIDPNTGHAMYVVENEFQESGWIKILSAASGTLEVGDSSQVDLDIQASFGERGEQNAEVVFTSSDIDASIVKVPVSLYLNQGPQFIDAASSLILSENESISLEIEIRDLEDHKFSVELADVPEFVTYKLTETNGVELLISPDYGDQGNYTIKVTAVDEYEAVNVHSLDIHVAKTNRAPEFIGDLLEFRLSLEKGIEKFAIQDYFVDPDGDAFSFVIESKDYDIIDAYQSSFDAFILEPNSIGETSLVFHLKDTFGATSSLTIKGIVTAADEANDCISSDAILVQMWNSTFVVNNPNNTYVAYQWYKNGIKVEGATKQYYSENSSQELDVYAQYSVALTRADGEVETTCPIQPVRYEASVKAFPNPIKSGASVTVVTQLPNLEANAATIQVVNMNGQVLQTLTTNQAENTIHMPYGSGVYIIKVSNQAISKSFKILVN